MNDGSKAAECLRFTRTQCNTTTEDRSAMLSFILSYAAVAGVVFGLAGLFDFIHWPHAIGLWVSQVLGAAAGYHHAQDDRYTDELPEGR